MSNLEFALVGLAAAAGGAVNALAGGGTLITFPLLVAVGMPAIAANVTNTVALCPGYLGGAIAQSKSLRGNTRRLWLLAPVSALGGIIGASLLMHSSDQAFRRIVPYLILLASGLLAAQGPVRSWLKVRSGSSGPSKANELWALLPVGLAAVYGGYFGAGLSVIVLAVLGLVMDDSLTQLNALKQVVSLTINVAAAMFFVLSGHVVWPVALEMSVCALIGGALGGRLAGWIRPEFLRRIVVTVGVVIAVVYFVR